MSSYPWLVLSLSLSTTLFIPYQTSVMASSTSKAQGKRPISVEDDFDIDELDGADSNTVVLSSG